MHERSITLRSFEETDRDTLTPWFPPKGPGVFMPDAALDGANETPARLGEAAFLVGCRRGAPVSFLYFNWVSADRAIVSINVAPEVRRSGVATATLEALRDRFPEINEFAAYVDPKNVAILKLLEGIGLIRVPSNVKERELFVWRRDGSPLPDDWTPPA
jgi:RimJ/RimL family protein N-acetyltransferase